MDPQTLSDHIKMFIALILGSITAITLNQWVAVSTIIYTLMQITLLMPKYWAAVKRRFVWIKLWWGKRAANENER